MTIRKAQQEQPPASALQKLLQGHDIPPDSPHAALLHHLALQIAHNLQYQHNWTDLRIHTHSFTTKQPLPRPLVSGVPPQRLYIHPDEQIELLQKQKDAGKKGLPDLKSEREWVLPSHLREKWSLRRFGEVFDGIGLTPQPWEGIAVNEMENGDHDVEEKENKWRSKKRVLLATLDDDSTVVYYIVHDGIVKPRQN